MNITSLEALRALYDPVRERSAKKELPQLDVHATRFIGFSPLVVLSSAGANGALDASPRGGEPGFVKVLDPQTLLIPDAPGNNRLETLRVNGRALLTTDEADRERCTDARRMPKLVIRVAVQASYLHCAKALMRSSLWDASRQVERSVMPSMGEMLRDQIGDRLSTDAPVETQAQMLERYRQTL